MCLGIVGKSRKGKRILRVILIYLFLVFWFFKCAFSGYFFLSNWNVFEARHRMYLRRDILLLLTLFFFFFFFSKIYYIRPIHLKKPLKHILIDPRVFKVFFWKMSIGLFFSRIVDLSSRTYIWKGGRGGK